jgi:hypothetical protein
MTIITLEDISWSDCVGICTDGAEALTGHKDFQAEVGQAALHANFIYCVIHRQALASRYLEPQSRTIPQETVEVMNLVKVRPLNSRLFAELCEEI